MNTFSSRASATLVVTFFVGVANMLFVPTTASAQTYYNGYNAYTGYYGSQANSSADIQNLLPKCTLGANPVLVNSPYTTTLSWTTQNAASVAITDVGSVATTGQYTVPNIYGTRMFTLTATNAYGTRTCDVTVYGQGYPSNGYNGSLVQQYNPSTGTTGTAENPGCYIAVNPSVVGAQGTNATTLNWMGAGALSATISNIGTVATSGTQSITPTSNTTYTLTVFGLNGVTRSCSASVQVASATGAYYANQYPYTNTPTPYYNQSQPYPYTYTTNTSYNDVAYPYTSYTTNYTQPSPVTYGSTYGQRSVRLSRVPYTGPVDDMVAGLFSLATLVTSVYGMRRILA